MIIEEAFYAYIIDQSAITDMIGHQLFPDAAPQSATFPYVVYSRVATDTHYFTLGPSGTFTTGMMIECFSLSKSPLEAKKLGRLFRAALDGYAGDWGEIEIDGVFILDETDKVEFLEDGSDRQLYSVILMIDCWHERETALFLS